jgi:hypothetical protein
LNSIKALWQKGFEHPGSPHFTPHGSPHALRFQGIP